MGASRYHVRLEAKADHLEAILVPMKDTVAEIHRGQRETPTRDVGRSVLGN